MVALTVLSALTAAAAVAAAPTATTSPANRVAANSATLNGTVLPSQEGTTYYFQYGTSTGYGSQTPTEGPITGNQSKPKDVSADVGGLQPQTTYHYRLVATNAAGTSFGSDMTFTTAAGAAPPQGNALTLVAAPPTVIHGNTTVLSGRLTGPGNGGVTVTLEQNPFPYTGGFKDVATATTAANGDYAFAVRPTLNTRYRVSAKTAPPATSAEIQVNVRVKVTLRVGDRTPARGQRVKFSGLVIPAHDGKVAKIQRRTRTGGWRTEATATLKAAVAVNGITRSRYVRRLRIRRTGTYRVRVAPGDGDHLVGRSPTRKLVVH